ncbi:related to cholinesterase [Rhynchosporium agropyri]|uniref:Carboxylic ester hydrolase n=1 Tax=Rhynchosporium agropyri TaxID=914238 RepID=A0A1E1L2S9_9HELO|nr:related to cholinesterase [Rhynchosporium agropyri]
MYSCSYVLSLVAAFSVAVLGFPAATSDRPQIDLGYEIHQGQFNVSFDAFLIDGLNTHRKQSSGQYYNFSNIRYAAPPIGNLRFAPPAAPSTAEKVFNDGSNLKICPNAIPAWSATATKWLTQGIGSINITAGYTIPNITTAPPAMPGTPTENEDCLFLDVLVPKGVYDSDMREKGVPVVVWIHGGGYTIGWKTQYGSGVGLINASRRDKQEGIIYVALNYRLGLFGFLSGNTFKQQSGTPNAGLLDQRFALEWVQKNIAKFGGDPNRVTVLGESAGGGSIMHQITANGGTAKAPFQQAIIQSGAFLPVPGMERQENLYEKFRNITKVQTLDQARKLTTEELQFANAKIVGESNYGDFSFNPAVDGTFATDLPGKLLLEGKFDKSVRVLVGHNADEGLFFTSPFVFTDEIFKKNVIDVSFPNADKNNVTSYILDTLYPNVLDGTYGYNNSIARATYILSEALFSCNAQYLSRAFGLNNDTDSSEDKDSDSSNDAYSYVFSVPPALHGEDVYYTFYEGPSPLVKNDTLALIMQSYFTNFIKGGDPNGEGLPNFRAYDEKTAKGEGVLMNLGQSSTVMIPDYLPRKRCGWWQQALYA